MSKNNRSFYVVMTIVFMAEILYSSLRPDRAEGSTSMLLQIFNNLLHVPMYGLLAYLVLHCFSSFVLMAYVSAFLIAALYGALNEVVQYFVPGRTASVMDVLLNMTGVALVLGHKVTRTQGHMLKNTHVWLPGYVKQYMRRAKSRTGTRPTHVMFCVADHFEPKWKRPSSHTEAGRVNVWARMYPKISLRHTDCEGINPRHTFFYPQEEYEQNYIDKLTSLCRRGFGEIEMHLHHDNDTEEGLRYKIESYKEELMAHNLLSRDRRGNIRYGFIHGNWSLCNSRRDGRWCGVNNELRVLKETGCYADFTLPSAPSDTQTRKINSIYYAENTSRPKSHNTGIDVECGREPSGDLMIIQGPLALNWKRKKYRIFPKIENSCISLCNPPAPERIDLWIDQKISVKGRPDWIFVKVYTHGAQDENLTDEYFKNLDAMFSYLEKRYNDKVNYKLHYVTTREMYNIIKAAEAGEQDEPGAYREYELRTNISRDEGRGTRDVGRR